MIPSRLKRALGIPSTDFTDDDLDALIETLGLTGFSQAALTKWHRAATKTSRSQLETLLRSVDLEPRTARSNRHGARARAANRAD